MYSNFRNLILFSLALLFGCYARESRKFFSKVSTASGEGVQYYHLPNLNSQAGKCPAKFPPNERVNFKGLSKFQHIPLPQTSLHGVTQDAVHDFSAQGTNSDQTFKIIPLVTSGPSQNRVNLVFFGDGYLKEEYDKFVSDATRLAQDVSGNQTFYSVKPLLNFWGAFLPSNESGIGVGGIPKDTVFGLYRDGTELRGVYYDKPEVAKAACDSMGSQCDYPILLGNDPLYGGLGGDFTVVTSSVLNGPLVLRHELGHSIIEVGEEYDGGFAYFGVNAAHNVTDHVSWSHWLSGLSTKDADKQPRIERSVMPMQAYPWTMLNTTSPWTINFTSSGTYSRHLTRFSLSGLPEKHDLKVELDGIDLDWTPRDSIGLDRWHYDIHRNISLTAGQHEVKFTLLNGDREDFAQLCSVEILEFGDEEEFISTPGYYGVFPTFSETNETSYRPTNDDCLMRSVTSPNFCKVCLEGLWLSLLKHVNLVDGINEGCEWRTPSDSEISIDDGGAWFKSIDLKLVPLAQFRNEKNIAESYTITWSRDGKVIPEFTNKTRLEVEEKRAAGTYDIDIQFTTDQVRKKSNLLASRLKHDVNVGCSH